jgi:hypothetical protein|tara:strand:+ start:213 stop:593 length:381 start_codon:yes stop_codon:yes gene_type:complete
MTEQEVMEWMEGYLEATMPKRTALGMIKADIKEYGFDTFLELPPETIIESYLFVADEVTQDAVDDFKALLSQERELDDLGLEQSFRLNPSESMQAMKNGMTDIMKSLMLYIEVQRMANNLIESHEN